MPSMTTTCSTPTATSTTRAGKSVRAWRSKTSYGLFHGDAFGKVARFVYVKALGHAYVVGQQLQGDDAQHGSDDLVGFGHGEDVVRHRGDDLVAFAGDGQHQAFPGFDLLDVAHDLFMVGVLGGDENDGQLVVHQGDRAVFHFRGGVALGVYIGNLFQLQGAFQGHREVVSPAKVEEIPGVFVFVRDLFYKVGLLKDDGYLFGDGRELRAQVLVPFDVDGALGGGDLERHHRQDRQLTRK